MEKLEELVRRFLVSAQAGAVCLIDLVVDGYIYLTENFRSYSVLTHEEIQALIVMGYITADPSRVNATSVDVTLHNQYMTEAGTDFRIVDLKAKQVPEFHTCKMGNKGKYMLLAPSKFMLGATEEIFNLPDNITAVFYMKSSLARAGLDHCNAGFIDPGFNNSRLTLELTNLLTWHTLKLTEGMPIGQVKFYRHKMVPAEYSYRATGQYNGDRAVQGSKGAR